MVSPVYFRFSVDGTAIREFKNFESIGIPFPKTQAMRIYSSLWNADDWATQGGRVKTDWSKAPFTASYRNFNANACIWSNGKSSCSSSSASRNNAWLTQELDTTSQARMKWVQTPRGFLKDFPRSALLHRDYNKLCFCSFKFSWIIILSFFMQPRYQYNFFPL